MSFSTIYRGGAATTFRRGEGSVNIRDLEEGKDVIRCWLKAYHYLVPLKGKKIHVHKYVGNKRMTMRGYYLTNVRGLLIENDTSNQEMHIACSPGAHGWPFRVESVCIVPWLAMRRIETVRRRINEEGNDNPRFPLIFPIEFNLD